MTTKTKKPAPKKVAAQPKKPAPMTHGFFDRNYIEVERSMTEDLCSVRWREIRAITGAVDEHMQVIEGACTLYMEGELGFMVNHDREDVIAMVESKQVTQ